MKLYLIGEAIAIEHRIFCNWDSQSGERLWDIWEELRAPYKHFYSGNISDQVGAGWWSEVLKTFEQIDVVMKSAPDYKFNIRQIKEKFGTIRFYYDLHKVGDEDREAEDAVLDDLRKKVFQLARQLEAATYSKCEVCGQEGLHRNNGWMKTLCDAHDAVQKKKFAALGQS